VRLLNGYRSSAHVGNLVKLEQQIAKLLPPAWPDQFPPIDPAKWEAGKALFEKEPGGCRGCHAVISPDELLARLTRPTESSDRAERLKRCLTETSPVLAYKGRPLAGAWATAPYLHNGSVPTLFDLMLPPADRPKSFVLGTREFDPERVGFVNEASSTPWKSDQAARENTFVFQTHDSFGHPIPGNDNAAHDYGNARFSDEERWALVEYMKAVGGKRVGDRIVP
jgi:hypothetical protein